MYRQRNSPALKKARQRALNMGSLDPQLDLGHGLTLPTYLEAIDITHNKFEAYNTALLQLTRLYDEAMEADMNLTDLNERMFSGILTKFGRNSTEYKMAGGRLKSRKTGQSSSKTSATEGTVTEGTVTDQILLAVSAKNAVRNGSGNGNGKATKG
jgi:hypothetical protein